MEVADAMRKMVDESGLTRSQISARMGRYDSYISQLLTRPSVPGADTVAAVAHACGYRLELVPMDGGESIAIGPDEMDDSTTRPDDIARARALLGRAAVLLDSVASSSD